MKCPKCNTELGEGSYVDINTIGWCCSNCNMKIYEEK